ncbi:hypothetical protein EMCRGX_G029773 [Ephydatia muelleri]
MSSILVRNCITQQTVCRRLDKTGTTSSCLDLQTTCCTEGQPRDDASVTTCLNMILILTDYTLWKFTARAGDAIKLTLHKLCASFVHHLVDNGLFQTLNEVFSITSHQDLLYRHRDGWSLISVLVALVTLAEEQVGRETYGSTLEEVAAILETLSSDMDGYAGTQVRWSELEKSLKRKRTDDGRISRHMD